LLLINAFAPVGAAIISQRAPILPPLGPTNPDRVVAARDELVIALLQPLTAIIPPGLTPRHAWRGCLAKSGDGSGDGRKENHPVRQKAAPAKVERIHAKHLVYGCSDSTTLALSPPPDTHFFSSGFHFYL
jgi:hypothetical protein